MPNTFSNVKQHIVQRIRESQVQQAPFEHCVVDNIFPEDFFSALHEMWPGDDILMPIPKTGRTAAQKKDGTIVEKSKEGNTGPYKERHVMLFDNRFMEKLSSPVREFWLEVQKIATGGDLINAGIQKFKKTLLTRIRHIDGDVQVNPELLVVSDRSDYAIGPHTDLPSRFLTILFYLSKDEKYRSYGTGLYVPKNAESLDDFRSHHEFKDFDLHSRVDFVPNRAVIFPRTNRSYHGVEPVPVENCDRRLLILNVRAPEGAR